MALKNQVANVYSAGINNVGSYQVSGRPWITAYIGKALNNIEAITFPKVTKSITVVNMASATVRIYFAHPTTDNAAIHYIELDSDEDSFTFNVRVKELWVKSLAGSSDYTVYAELTNIEADLMYSYNANGQEGISD